MKSFLKHLFCYSLFFTPFAYAEDLLSCEDSNMGGEKTMDCKDGLEGNFIIPLMSCIHSNKEKDSLEINYDKNLKIFILSRYSNKSIEQKNYKFFRIEKEKELYKIRLESNAEFENIEISLNANKEPFYIKSKSLYSMHCIGGFLDLERFEKLQ